MIKNPASDDEIRTEIRMSRELHDRLKAAAAERVPRHSLNREILWRLHQSFEVQPPAGWLEKMEVRLAELEAKKESKDD